MILASWNGKQCFGGLFGGLLGSAVLHLTFSAVAAAATSVGGSLSGNQTWTKAGSPYVLNSNVTVQSGATLTIEPGVRVESQGNRGLKIAGQLSAIGTPTDPVTLAVEGGTRFFFPSAGSTLRWATVRDATNFGSGLSIDGDGACCAEWPSVDHVQFINNGIAANLTYAPQASIPMSDLAFIGNSTAIYAAQSGDLNVTDFFVDSNAGSDVVIRTNDAVFTHGNLLPPLDPLAYSVSSPAVNPGTTVTLSDVWWGTTNLTAIETLVFDQADDPSAGEVSVLSPATGPLDVYPPTSLVADGAGNSGFWNNASVFSGTASDMGLAASGVQSVGVSIQRLSDGKWWNGASWAGTEIFLSPTGTTNWQVLAPPLAEAAQLRIRSQATDALGRPQFGAASQVLTLDTTPPLSFALQAPAEAAQNLTSSPTFSWDTTSDAVSGVDHYELWIDGTKNKDLTPAECSVSSCSTGPQAALVDGPHNWQVKATDVAGNTHATATRNFTVDLIPPLSFNLAAPADSAFLATATPTLSWDATTDAGSGLDHYEVMIDGSQQGGSIASSTTSYTPSSGLSDASHTWKVTAVDANGNPRSTSTRSFTVDTTPPSTALGAGGPSGTTVATSASFAFSSPESGVDFECQLDTGQWTACSSPKLFVTLPDGPHVFRVRAKDALGNTDATPAVRSWTVDTTTLPTARLNANPSIIQNGQSVSFDATGSVDHADGTIVSYAWDLDDDGSFETTQATGTTSRIYDEVGSYTATVRVTNNSGKTAVASQQVEVRLAPPSGPLGVSVNAGAQYTNDPNVTISAVWPYLATEMVMSNDGGFGSAQTKTVSAETSWKLDSSGPERLPKTIYVRFVGGESGKETYQDDIILDETAPTVSSASVTDGGTPAIASFLALASSTARSKIEMKASDKTSGVGYVQTAVKKKHPSAKRKYARSFTVKGAKPKYVRVQDKAGNFSKWKKLSRRR